MSENKFVFGRAMGSEIVHIANQPNKRLKTFNARCNKQTIVTVDSTLEMGCVTCAKCQRYADYRAELEGKVADPNAPTGQEDSSGTDPKPKVEGEPKSKAEPKSNGKAEPEPEPKAKAEPEPGAAEPKTGGKKLSEENYKEFLKGGEKPSEKPQKHFVHRLSPNKKIYIVHTPSGQTMFTDVNEKALGTVLKYLNNVKIKWENKEDSLPKGFISAIRGAFEAAYKSHNLKTNVNGDKPKESPEETAKKALDQSLKMLAQNANKGDTLVLFEKHYFFDGERFVESKKKDIPKTRDNDIPKTGDKDKPKTGRVIMRRDKSAKKDKKPKKDKSAKKKDKPKTGRVITRRDKSAKKDKDAKKDKKNIDRFGFTVGSLRSQVMVAFDKGGKISEIAKTIAKKNLISETKAIAKIKAMIRKSRQMDLHLVIITMKDPKDDFYQFSESRDK
jgi:hypothetical protein